MPRWDRLQFQAALPGFLRSVPGGVWGFAFRTALAAVLALFAAFQLQLESPYWSATTALIVANPVYGQIVSKSIYRVLGTLTGVIMSLILTALFAQTPELFLFALSFWIGCCLTVATMLRNFQAYGAMLAGLTTAIITLAVISDHPLNIFTVAMARMAAILVGIAASALVSGLLKPGGAAYNLQLKMEAMIQDSAKLMLMLNDLQRVLEVKDRRRQLANEILTLDSLVTFAEAESVAIREQHDGLLSIGAALLHVATAVGNAAYSLNRMPVEERQNPLLRAALAEITPAAELIARKDAAGVAALIPLRDRLAALEAEAAHQSSDDVLVVIHRLQEMLEQLGLAAGTWLGWKAGRTIETQARFNFHREFPDALRNGGRCFLAVGAAGAFWIFSAWPAGGNLVLIVTIVCSFAAIQEDPLAFGPSFLWGVLFLVPLAMVCDFYIFNAISDFLPLALVLVVCVMAGCIAATSPNFWIGGAGRTFIPLFFTLVALRNPMSYDFSSFLNSSEATIAGVCCAIVATILFLPPDPIGRAMRLVQTLKGETEYLAARTKPGALPKRSVWESEMYDRLRLSLPHFKTQRSGFSVIDRAYATILVGASVIDLRNRAGSPEMPSSSGAAINQAVDQLRDVTSSAPHAADSLESTARSLVQTFDEETSLAPESRDLLIRCASTLRGTALLVRDLATPIKESNLVVSTEAHP